MNTGNKFLIIGLGNPLLTDDTIGPHIIGILKEDPFINNSGYFDLKTNFSGGIDLLEDICEYTNVLILDCLENSEYQCGTCIEFDIEDLYGIKSDRFVNTHGLNLPSIFELGNKLGFSMPKECKILGITGKNCKDFSETPSVELILKLDQIIENIKNIISRWPKVISGRN